MNIAENSPWYFQVLQRIRKLFFLKAIGTTAFMYLFFRGYFAILNYPLTPPTTMPLTPVDQWIPFTTAALPAYVSLWVYVSLPAALVTDFKTLLRLGFWCAAMCLFCLGIFWFWPSAVPPLPAEVMQYPEMALLRGVDPGGNACPSLHVASAVFAAFWLDRIWLAIGAPSAVRWLSLLHCVVILWSTMAIRQHVFLDVLAGLLVGLVFAPLSLRDVRRAVEGNAR